MRQELRRQTAELMRRSLQLEEELQEDEMRHQVGQIEALNGLIRLWSLLNKAK